MLPYTDFTEISPGFTAEIAESADGIRKDVIAALSLVLCLELSLPSDES